MVGPSGAGKTTLAQVLLRFLDARAGTYTLGTADAAGLDGDDVRRLVGLCAQDAHIFDSSVRENLRLARTDATEEQLRDALAAARLLTWVDGLPDGLDTMAGEHGARSPAASASASHWPAPSSPTFPYSYSTSPPSTSTWRRRTR